MKNLLKAIKQHNKDDEEDEKYVGGLWDYCGDLADILVDNNLIKGNDHEIVQTELYQFMTT